MTQIPDRLHDRLGTHDLAIPLGTVRAKRGVWTWSDSVYAMHGFEPGEVVPTADVMLAHCHPADRERLASVLVTDDSELSQAAEQYRLIDTRGAEHWVALTVEWSPDDALLYGSMLDLTSRHTRASAEAATSMLSEALESRSVIDQAKGAIQLVYGMDDSTAFNLLKWHSQQMNVKLRTVAANLVEALSTAQALPPAMKRRLDQELLDLEQARPVGSSIEETEQPFEVELVHRPDAEVVAVRGDVDLATAPLFAASLRSACESASAERGVVVDLTCCPHVGPAGLRELAAARRRLERRSAHLVALVSEVVLNPAAVAEVVDTTTVPAPAPAPAGGRVDGGGRPRSPRRRLASTDDR